MQFLHGGVGALAVQTMEVVRLLPECWSPLANDIITWGAVINDIITWGAVIGALGVMVRYVIKPLVEKLALINHIWEKLQHEFEPNSGTSLRDAVDRTDLRVAELSDRFDDLDIRVDRLDRKMTQHMADVKENGESS